SHPYPGRKSARRAEPAIGGAEHREDVWQEQAGKYDCSHLEKQRPAHAERERGKRNHLHYAEAEASGENAVLQRIRRSETECAEQAAPQGGAQKEDAGKEQ